ncbi:MAG: tetratricopeptide repeat protein [Planctomycetota bacterium]
MDAPARSDCEFRGARCCAMAIIVSALAGTLAGCRAIGGFGESRQSLAARRLSRQGLKSMRQGDWVVAETLFNDALEVSERNDSAHRGLSESLWRRGQTDKAIAHMQEAVKLSAGDGRHLQRLGRMYLELGRVDDAAEQCRLALANDRDWGPLWTLWGDCQYESKQWDDALAAYHRALALNPDDAHAKLKCAEIYHHQKRYDRLLATLDRFDDDHIAVDPDTPFRPGHADLLRGIAMRAMGRDGEAARYLASAARRNPADATPRLHLASLAMADGRTDVAQVWLARANQLNPALRSVGFDPIDATIAGSAEVDAEATVAGKTSPRR